MKKFYTLALAAFATMAMNAQIYVCGTFDGENHWTPEAPAAIGTLNEAGNWEVTVHDCAAFKVSTAYGDWDVFNEKAFSLNEGTVTEAFINDFFDVMAWGENTNLPWKGDWTIEVTPDYSKMKLTSTSDVPTGPIAAFVVGGMTDWGFVEGWKMTTVEEFKYTFKCEGATMIPAGEEFKLAADGWAQVNYSTGGEALADGEPSEASYDIQTNMFFSEDFEGEIVLELTNGYNKPAQVTFNPGDLGGVENVAVENNAAPEYFNLQGVRVAQPEQGALYIVRRGNEVSKVLVK
ncbi:MAG: hypothetical protein NC418_01315 [Muribaculaceae bacterium]|nr:hypothetical protein [Muribaculaceae bacterium]